MAGDVRQGPRNIVMPKPQAQQQVPPPPQQQVLFDVGMIEQLAEICKHYNLTQINVGNIAVVNTRLEPNLAHPEAKPVTDEEVLHNPYAGM